MESKTSLLLKSYWVLILIIAVKFILQYHFVNPVYELHRDEFLHLDQARHLAFGFISVPPFTSLVSKLIFMLGGGIFWVRFFPALFGAASIVFTWLIVESLGGKYWSKLLASLGILFSVLIRLNILFQPNSFDILAWTIMFFLLIKFLQSGNTRLLIYMAIVAVVGLYNKYNMAFLLFGLFAAIIISPQRKLFFISKTWQAVLLAVLLLAPNIWWQAAHHFPVMHHMRVLKETQLDNNSAMGFLKGQIMFFFGSIPLTIAALAGLFFYKPFRNYRLIGICFVLTIALFSILKAKDYYAIGLYPVLFAFGSVYLEKTLGGLWKKTIIPLLITINLGVFFIISMFVFPVLSPAEIAGKGDMFKKMGLLRWEDGIDHQLPQDFADMIGWKEMAGKALSAYNQVPADEKEFTLVFCDNYGQTGALNYYNRGKMPEAYSFNTDYIFWIPRMQKIQNVLLVGEKPDPGIIDMFTDFQELGQVENEYAREKNTGIYLLLNANDGFTQGFYKTAEERKRNFDIF